MKTLTRIKLLSGILMILGMGFYTLSSACNTNFTYTYGPNGQVNFFATYSNFNFNPSFFWNNGDVNPYMWGQNPNHQYKTNGTYTVTLIATDSLCSDTVTQVITVSNACGLIASYTDTNIGHGIVKFTSTSVGVNQYSKYFWTFGDGSPRVQGKDTITHKYMYNGTYTAWLTVEDTNFNGCIDSTYLYITVTNGDSSSCLGLHVNFIYSNGPNGHVTFTSTSIGVHFDAQYYWNPGDGSPVINSGYNNFCSHTYQSNNTFNATLKIIQDSGNCFDSIILPVTVNNVVAPCNMAASFIMTKDSNGTETFTSTSTGVYSWTTYYWNPGDGSPVVSGVNMTTYVHTYPFIGWYSPTLTTLDTGIAFCEDSARNNLYIRNRDSLWACFTWTADTIVPGKYNFTSCSHGTNGYTYFKWNPGDNTPADSGIGMNTYTHTYGLNGPYSATLYLWYTQIPHRAQRFGSPHYSEVWVTNTVHVNTVNGILTTNVKPANFSIYPNPNKGNFRVVINNLSEQNAEVEIEITNLLGETISKTVCSASANHLDREIDMKSSPSGVYFVRVTAGKYVFTSKMLIQK